MANFNVNIISGNVELREGDLLLVNSESTINVRTELSKKENITNRAYTLNAESTNDQYPTAKTVYDFVSSSVAEVPTDLTGLFASASYDSGSKKIYFYDNNGTASGEVDATAFIKDGMVNTVTIDTGSNQMIITFNTDAGKEDIALDLTQIFNPNNYYTKTEVNTISSSLSASVAGKQDYFADVENSEDGTYLNVPGTGEYAFRVRTNDGEEWASIIGIDPYMTSLSAGDFRTASAELSLVTEEENSPHVNLLLLDQRTSQRAFYQMGVDGIDLNQKQVHSLADPTSSQDAATKNYVDTVISNIPSVDTSSLVKNNQTGSWASASAWLGTNSASIYTGSIPEEIWVRGKGSGSTVLSGSVNASRATGQFSIANVYGANASGDYAHAEGWYAKASGESSHAEGHLTLASGNYSHAEGFSTTSSNKYSHAEGSGSTASGESSHAEGCYTSASGTGSHAEGNSTTASGNYSHAEGNHTVASGNYSHAEGYYTTASGFYSHAEGLSTVASGSYSHAEGSGSKALGTYSHAEGFRTTASGDYSHAEGYYTAASKDYSHAEGNHTVASGSYSHAEGYNTTASGIYSHAEGQATIALGNSSHAEGQFTTASGQGSHAEGFHTTTSRECSHAEGSFTIASNNYEHAQGTYNATASSQIFSIGVGDATTRRKNAISIITGSGTVSSASIYIYGVGSYNGTNPEPGVNDIATVISSITGSGGGGGIGTETDPIYKADSASLKASASLAQGIASITASLVASASVAKTASSSAAAISAKTGSYDALQGLPAVTAADNGKVLMVVNGAWTLVQAVSIYTGSAAPDNSQGNNGDIYLQS